MNINIITLFPEIFAALNSGLLGQAIERKDITINLLNLRDCSMNKHGQVDDKPYGGGEGMVLMAEPLEQSIKNISEAKRGQSSTYHLKAPSFLKQKHKTLQDIAT